MQHLGLLEPLARDHGADREAVARMTDGVDKEVFERQGAVALGKRHPGRDGAGNGDAVRAECRHLRQCRRSASGVHAAGARPEAFSPCSRLPSQISAKASPPMPFIVGSTTVSVIAAARAASMALPPRAKAAAPACDASGCDVATTLRAMTGWRPERCESDRSCDGRPQILMSAALTTAPHLSISAAATSASRLGGP